ncbi:hypothetical protein Aperf_G00000032990 [Anoplocephala perfoliata]
MDEGLSDEVRDFNDGFRAFQEKITFDLLSLIKEDEYLKDISRTDVNSVEKCIDNAIALHHGQAMRLVVVRGDERLPITVSNDGKVHDLFTTVANAIDEKLANEKAEYQDLISKIDKHDKALISRAFSLNPPPRRLNWQRFWRTHCLASNEAVMKDRNTPLKKVPGLSNNNVIRFVRRNRKKPQ